MENIININLFIEHLTYHIKMGVYVNKGTDQDILLERSIKMHNKYKTIQASGSNILKEDEAFVKKCLKRLNLILKIDSDEKPVDIAVKENQLRMLYLQGHPGLENDDMNSLIEHADANKINIFTGIPLTFILREGKYQALIWQYTRSLFYISQALISSSGQNGTDLDDLSQLKQQIFDDAAEKLEEILIKINDLEESIKMNQIMAHDTFLSGILTKSGISKANVDDARTEVKEIFEKKGLTKNKSMGKMIDSISSKLENMDFTKGNIIQSMFGIAQNVANELKGDIENNPEGFQESIGAITEIFKDAMGNSDGENKIPSELKGLMNSLMSVIPNGGATDDKNPPSEEQIQLALENFISVNELDRDDFYQNIKDESGEIDLEKLQTYLNR